MPQLNMKRLLTLVAMLLIVAGSFAQVPEGFVQQPGTGLYVKDTNITPPGSPVEVHRIQTGRYVNGQFTIVSDVVVGSA